MGVDGVKIGQSKTIERYLSKQLGFAGSNDVEAAQVDMVCEHVKDIKDAYQKVRGTKDEAEKEAGMKKWFGEDLPEWTNKLEKAVGVDYAVGSAFTLADLSLWMLYTQFFDNKEGTAAAHASAPRVTSIVQKVSGMDAVNSWMQKRPKTMF